VPDLRRQPGLYLSRMPVNQGGRSRSPGLIAGAIGPLGDQRAWLSGGIGFIPDILALQTSMAHQKVSALLRQ
jgi:hypothetical protein